MAFQVSRLHSKQGNENISNNVIVNIGTSVATCGDENGVSSSAMLSGKPFQNQSNQNGSKRGVLEDISNRTKGFLSSVGLTTATKSNIQQSQQKQINIKPNDPQLQHVQVSASSIRESLPLDEVDLSEQTKPRYCTLYVNDIFRNFRENEIKYMAPYDYMSSQDDINEKMRAMLINWMIEVHHKFKLEPQTMYLTVNYLDRFLSKKVISRKRLQLIGCTAMLVASKYEEIYAPEAADFVYVSDHSFTKNDLFQMEGIMINALDFNLTFPSSLVFLNRYSKVGDCDSKTKSLATCLLEFTMIDYSMLRYNPSMIAASSLLLAMQAVNSNHGMDIDNNNEWTSLLVKHTQYEENDLISCMDDIKIAIKRIHERNLRAISKKYSTEEMMLVSILAQ